LAEDTNFFVSIPMYERTWLGEVSGNRFVRTLILHDDGTALIGGVDVLVNRILLESSNLDVLNNFAVAPRDFELAWEHYVHNGPLAVPRRRYFLLRGRTNARAQRIWQLREYIDGVLDRYVLIYDEQPLRIVVSGNIDDIPPDPLLDPRRRKCAPIDKFEVTSERFETLWDRYVEHVPVTYTRYGGLGIALLRYYKERRTKSWWYSEWEGSWSSRFLEIRDDGEVVIEGRGKKLLSGPLPWDTSGMMPITESEFSDLWEQYDHDSIEPDLMPDSDAMRDLPELKSRTHPRTRTPELAFSIVFEPAPKDAKGSIYHFTTKQALESIKKDGVIKRSECGENGSAVYFYGGQVLGRPVLEIMDDLRFPGQNVRTTSINSPKTPQGDN
jgi:hypothetical protein